MIENQPVVVSRATCKRDSIIDEPPDFLFIGELAQATGTNPRTIRFYEREGLVLPARRGRFRVYSRANLQQLRSVLKMRAMGISLARIRRFLSEGSLFEDETRARKFADLLKDHLGELERRRTHLLTEIQVARNALLDIEKRYASRKASQSCVRCIAE
jgi:DNA-binding transcriptional MerR regulator